MNLVDNCLDKEAVDYVSKQCSAVTDTFIAMTKFTNVNNITIPIKEPANKNIQKQLNFYSTKKKRKVKSQVRFAKPSRDEIDGFYNAQFWEIGNMSSGVHGKYSKRPSNSSDFT
jgi:hypothetical protein